MHAVNESLTAFPALFSLRPVLENLFYCCRMPRQPPFHVWVDLTGRWYVPAPGVLLAWRHSDRRGWEAWVVRVESYSTGTGSEVLMSQSWVSAALVRPAEGEP
ncbi:hypothetical protein GCM10009641_32950 [Mycobacterium cookii]|uniref:Uncharacterized protein n=1 Tax=Nocardioides furvisabuli TaxID=375542 RepID=A0ABP5JAH7_9ACTN